MDNPPAKKTKLSSPTIPPPLSPSIATQLSTINSNYKTTKPYPHARITDIMDNQFCRNVIRELKENLTATYKESDLFKFYQTLDLGNLSPNTPLSLKIPSVMSLRSALFSQSFRNLIESSLSLPPNTLTSKVDCAVNVHAEGCHLLCHDDVIGSRRVSFIVYLTDEGWGEEDGGKLELYSGTTDSKTGRTEPQASPSVTLPPLFNSMSMFTVTPNLSFHSVEEVRGTKPRMSIQGWYHGKEDVEMESEGTLGRLKEKGRDNLGEWREPTEKGWRGKEGKIGGGLREGDIEVLRKYVNPTYLEEGNIKSIRSRFEEDSSVMLRGFLRDDVAREIAVGCLGKDEREGLGDGGKGNNGYDTGVGGGWVMVGPSHKQRYLEYEGGGEGVGERIKDIKEELMDTGAWYRFLEEVTGLDAISGHRGKIRRFRPGYDYTVAHYGVFTEESVLDGTLCFVKGSGRQAGVVGEDGERVESDENDEIWQSGEVGGYEAYVGAEEDEEGEGGKGPDDEYDPEGEGELLSVQACFNSLSLCFRDWGTMRFIKYLGCKAPGSRFDLEMVYRVEDFEEGEEEGGKENGAKGEGGEE